MIDRAESDTHRVDSTHPPTRMRMSALEQRDYGPDILTSSSDEATVIDTELRASHRPITDDLGAAVIR